MIKNINNVLVTGNLGYIGSVLTDRLIEKKYNVTGLDAGYFSDTMISQNKYKPTQIIKDIRDIKTADLINHDSIIHLAAISNDPLGELSPGVTDAINYKATIRLAKLARETGIKRFIYASSQSLYGISKTDNDLDEDNSIKNPITAYAKSKWNSEIDLKKLHSKEFNIIIFRPATVFGSSPRMRCDIVFNNLIGSAFTSKKIIIKSNGKPFRPAIHINDVCSAFIAGLEAPINLVSNEAFNIGIRNGNYTVLELANYAKKYVEDSHIVIKNETGHDERTYNVSFDKIYNKLGNFYSPSWPIDKGAKEIISFFKNINFNAEIFNGWKTNRLLQIKRLQKLNLVDKDLRIIK